MITIHPDYSRRLPVVDPDDHALFISLGRSFERVALTAARLNIRHAHLNMPCEEPSLRKELQHYLGFQNEQPLLRIGYAEPMPKSYRRSVEDVLIEA